MARVAHSPIVQLAPRTQPNHLATIQDIDDRLDGKIKAPVRVAATTNQAGTYSALVLTLGVNGVLSIDGVTLAAGNRVLLAGQTTATENGIYTVTDAGGVSAPAVLTRAEDFNASEKILSGVRINVDAGTQFHDSTWKLATVGAITLDATALEFVKSSASAGAAKHAATITGDGLQTDFVVQHDLGTTDVAATVRNIAAGLEVIVDWQPMDADSIKILFAVAPLNSMSFRVVVIG